ncbi:MAG: aminotransferase class V-fold PLP-dependent enzyme [Chloroflexi bacterium]|nr:aminotransferase class V-fold PLP-dependent enzyme [Chloroflexota bacterium]
MTTEKQVAYIRRELNLPDHAIAINAGSWGPLSRAAREAIAKGYEQEALARGDDPDGMRGGYMGLARYSGPIDEAKEEVARLLNCSPDEVALTDSSSTAMNVFLWGYDFEPGDEIIAGSLENPAASVPLMVIAQRRKLTLRIADLGNGEKDSVEAVRKVLSPRTRMVLFSDATFATGGRADLKGISRLAHERDILVLADGIQTVGTYPVDVKEMEVDGYAIARHKFLCGPDGAGALYIRKGVFPRVLPTYSGVFTDARHGMSGRLDLMDTAQRYEVSTRPIPVIMGGTAALKWFAESVGWTFVYERLGTLYNQLWYSLDAIGNVQMISQPGQSGLITFAVHGADPASAVARLREHFIFGRTIVLTRPQGIRLSVGVWNRESDIERIAEVVESIAKNPAGKNPAG